MTVHANKLSLLTLFTRDAKVAVTTHTDEDVNVHFDARACVQTGGRCRMTGTELKNTKYRPFYAK